MVPEFSTQGLAQLYGSVPIVISHETPDSCRANGRMAAHRARTLPENCLYSVLPCCAHIVHLIIVGGPKAQGRV